MIAVEGRARLLLSSAQLCGCLVYAYGMLSCSQFKRSQQQQCSVNMQPLRFRSLAANSNKISLSLPVDERASAMRAATKWHSHSFRIAVERRVRLPLATATMLCKGILVVHSQHRERTWESNVDCRQKLTHTHCAASRHFTPLSWAHAHAHAYA